jgi:hypothetical protein
MPSVINDLKYDPPRMIPALVDGFNAVAAHIYIILFPILLDLLLWLGPTVRVKKFFLPLLLEASQVSAAAYGDQTVEIVEATREIWSYMLEQFNLLFSLRTFPIGLPSLMISYVANTTPFGDQMVIELNSGNTIFIYLIVFLLVGLLLGSIYFALTAGLVKSGRQPLQMKQIINQTLQGFFLALILITTIAFLAIPISCLLSSIMLIIPSLGSFPIIFLGMLAVWLGLPLAFSPHGIYVCEMKAGKAIVTSVRLVRSLMSVTGLFFIMLIVIGSGLDILWATPEANSWMLFVGIIGHAFISTGLLTASFIYYDKGIKWLQYSVQPEQKKKPSAVL